MPIYVFRCAAGHVRERLLPRDARDIQVCPCGQLARKIPAPFALLAPPTGAGLRSRYRLFEEASQEMDHAYAKAEATVEHPIPRPNLWGKAKQRAQQMIAAGAAPPARPPE